MLEIQVHGIKLRDYRQGTQKTLCPQCSHTRKKKTDLCLSVTIDHNGAVWHCHNCEWTGSSNEKTKKVFNYPAPVLTPKLTDWFSKRGIPESVVKRNKISYGEHFIAGKTVSCIKFPFYRDGKVINIKYRSADKQFAQEKDAEKIYFGLDDIKDAPKTVIVEGEMDKLALEVAGYMNVVSVPDGAVKAFKDGVIDPAQDTKFSYVWNCWKELEGKEIILAVDNDGPGDALAEELARRYGKDRCSRVKWSLKDANETLIEQGVDNLVYYIEHAKPYPVDGLYTVDDLMEEAVDFYENGAKKGVSTGFKSLDEFLTIRPGELSIVTGVPQSGKSEIIDALMVNIAKKEGWTFAICSFENPTKIHLGKLCEKYTGKPFNEGRPGRMTREEYIIALGWARKHFTFITVENGNNLPTVDWILEKAKIAVARYGIKGMVIDPYNEIEHKRPAGMTETEYVSLLLTRIKKFAQLYGVHVWFIAHPAKLYRDKEGKYPIPSLYDISGSSNFVNKADVGIVVHRPDPLNIFGDTEIHIKKMRFKENGKLGMISLEYDRNTGRYSTKGNYSHE